MTARAIRNAGLLVASYLTFVLIQTTLPIASSGCFPSTHEEKYKAAHSVFSARVLEVFPGSPTMTCNGPAGTKGSFHACVEVLDVWKGNLSEITEVHGDYPFYTGTCFIAGKEYLIYARLVKGPKWQRLVSTGCTGTKYLAKAKEELEYLGEAKSTEANPANQAPSSGRKPSN